MPSVLVALLSLLTPTQIEERSGEPEPSARALYRIGADFYQKNNYLEAIETEEPDILGMSALLTTTMPYMKVVIDTMVEQGIRDDYIVLVGGAPLNEEFGKAIGADAYCRDAAVAVETAKELVGRKHNQLAG